MRPVASLRSRSRLRAWLWAAALGLAVLASADGVRATNGSRGLSVAILPDRSTAFAERLRERLRLDPSTTLTADPRTADVVWLLARAATPEDVARAREARSHGAGLVVVAGPQAWTADLALAPRDGTAEAVGVERSEDAPGTLAPLIAWRSSPKLRARVGLTGEGRPSARTTDGAVVVLERPGEVWLGLAPDDASNEALARWGYWNYLVHAASVVAAGRTPQRFADWPGSPTPHAGRRAVWLTFLGAIWPLSVVAFFWARRRARREGPEASRRFLSALEGHNGTSSAEVRSAGWNRVGFARPLAGYFVLVGALVVFIAPYVAIVQFVVPTYVQKFPEVEGMWNSVYEFFWWVWIFFDMGTSVAFVKYFAELRTRDPDEALQAVQFYSWWQILTGALQVTAVAALGLFVVPHTDYALFSDLVALYGLTQWPGVFFTIAYFFQAAQRYDHYQALDLLQNRILVVVGPIPFVLLGRAWGAARPEHGEALGAMYGLAVGNNVVGLVVLVVSYALYRRLGVPVFPLFLAGFGKRTAKRLLGYGWKVMTAGVLFRIGNAIEIIVMTALLHAYSESMGIKSLLEYNFYFVFRFLAGWADPALAAFSEAHGAGKLRLLRYYIARYLQWGYLYCAVLFGFVVALAPLFIRRALDPRWAAAAPLVLAAAIRGFGLPPALVLDSVQKGCGRPGLNAILLGIEQLCRLGFLYWLVPPFQVGGAFLAMALALAVKGVLSFLIVDRAIVRLRLPLWSTFGAPLAAGAITFGVWKAVALVLTNAPRWQVIAAMLVAAVASFPLGFFLFGALGGVDPRAREELAAAAPLASVFAPVARLLAALAGAGARVRLVRPRFPEDLAISADQEARDIEAAEAAASASLSAT